GRTSTCPGGRTAELTCRGRSKDSDRGEPVCGPGQVQRLVMRRISSRRLGPSILNVYVLPTAPRLHRPAVERRPQATDSGDYVKRHTHKQQDYARVQQEWNPCPVPGSRQGADQTSDGTDDSAQERRAKREALALAMPNRLHGRADYYR